MDFQIMKNCLDLTKKRKKWVIALAAFGVSGYGVYKVYNLPSVTTKRKRLFKLLESLISIAEVVSDSVETIGVVSKDLNQYLKSDSDRIPNSMKQTSKIIRSDEFSDSVIRATRALTMGVLRGYQSEASRSVDESKDNSGFVDRVMDKITSPVGSGFASVVVGSFARNLVMASYSDMENGGSNSKESSISRVMDVVCAEKSQKLIGDSIQLFVSTLVSVYLEKTMDINTYDEFFSGLTNPNHETQVKDIVVSVCNGAVETLVKTSYQIFENLDSGNDSNQDSSDPATNGYVERESYPTELQTKNWFDKNKEKNNGRGGKMTSALAVPNNRSLVLDVTGKVTFETVRTLLEFSVEKLNEGLTRSLNVVHERCLEIVRYATATSSVVFTVWISVCLHILGGVWVLVPAY